MFPRRKEYENHPPLRDNIITVAVPGVTTSRSHISRYTGPDGVSVLHNACSWRPCRGNNVDKGKCVSVLDDENKYVQSWEEDPPILFHSKCRVSPRLLHNVMPSPEMDEIDYHHWSFNPVHWVLIAKSYLTDLFFSVRPLRGGYSRVSMTNLAGERDQAACRREVCRAVRLIKEREAASVGIVNCVKNSLDAHGTMTPERPLRIHLVLFGFSRGGSTVFYTAMKLPPELASYVSLVVVEAPFDTLHNVINSSCWFPSFTLWFFRTFCDCSEDAYSFDPSRIHLRCPFAFIMSCVDTRVPNHLTRRLIDMVETQCPQIPAVEVLELQHSRHPLMPVGNRADQDAYVDFMERLYDTYCS